MRMRDIADCMGVSDRTAFGVVNDLCEEGYLRRWKRGTGTATR
jgi:Mn-dependent DtxR family transcriptional regulator